MLIFSSSHGESLRVGTDLNNCAKFQIQLSLNIYYFYLFINLYNFTRKKTMIVNLRASAWNYSLGNSLRNFTNCSKVILDIFRFFRSVSKPFTIFVDNFSAGPRQQLNISNIILLIWMHL